MYFYMNLGAFAVVALVRRWTGSEDLEAFNGLIHKAPTLAVAMTIFPGESGWYATVGRVHRQIQYLCRLVLQGCIGVVACDWWYQHGHQPLLLRQPDSPS